MKTVGAMPHVWVCVQCTNASSIRCVHHYHLVLLYYLLEMLPASRFAVLTAVGV